MKTQATVNVSQSKAYLAESRRRTAERRALRAVADAARDLRQWDAPDAPPDDEWDPNYLRLRDALLTLDAIKDAPLEPEGVWSMTGNASEEHVKAARPYLQRAFEQGLTEVVDENGHRWTYCLRLVPA